VDGDEFKTSPGTSPELETFLRGVAEAADDEEEDDEEQQEEAVVDADPEAARAAAQPSRAAAQSAPAARGSVVSKGLDDIAKIVD
jgi:hypothetical protein